MTDSKLLEWYRKSDVGISSKAMVAVMLGDKPEWPRYCYPLAPADFNRCLMLVEAVPDVALFMGEISRICPVWKALVDRWDEIKDVFIGEVGLNWSNGGKASKTFKLMRSIIEQAGD